MPDKSTKQPRQRTGKKYSRNDMISFGEMVAHESINETDVSVYFKSIYEGKEAAK